MKESKMKKIVKMSVKPLVIGAVAVVFAILDRFIAPLFVEGASFLWVAFINWTVFFGVSKIERVKAIIGYIIGFASANLIVFLGNWVGAFIAIFIVNALVMYFENMKKLFIDSIPGIFVGIALTFSGVGVALSVNSFVLLGIIIVYGILGLLCGLVTNCFSEKILKRLK